MFYPKNTASGNAGEYYFAYWISRYFRWPCRLLSIDIGIDAQVEVFDHNMHSTGDFLAIQIKTTGGKSPNRPVNKKNLEYWKAINDVVLLVSVTTFNKNPKIYWKVINNEDIDYLIEKAEKNIKTESVTIPFNESNLLTEQCKNEWVLLPYRGVDILLSNLSEEIINICDENNQYFHDGQSYSPTNVSLECDFLIEAFDEVSGYFDEMEKISTSNIKLENLVPSTGRAYESYELFKTNLFSYLRYLFRANSEYKYEYKERWTSTEFNRALSEIVTQAYDES